MLTNQVLLKTIADMKGITGAEVSVWKLEGECILATNEVGAMQESWVSEYLTSEFVEFAEFDIEESIIRMVMVDGEPCYLLMFEGLEGDSEVITSLCVNQLEALIAAYKEPLSKSAFLRKLLYRAIPEEELVQKAERVRIPLKTRRVTYVIQPKNDEEEIVVHTLKSLFITGIADFVVEMEQGQIAFIKTLTTTDGYKEVHHIAETIVDTLNAEAMISVLVGYGTVVEHLVDVERSYREAKMAIEVGRSFEANKRILAYKELGIGRLIHQLSDDLCQEFLDEILGEEGLAQFDDDTMQAAYKFLENDLNISRTARALYVHRNTLSFRLEKIQSRTGLDVRVFEDAVTFKLAIMVSNHMEFNRLKR